MPDRDDLIGPARVAFFLPSLDGGGAERIMVVLANEMARRGGLVELVLARAEGPYLSDVDNAVTIVDLRAANALGGLWALVRYLRKKKPPVLLSALIYANVVSLVAKRVSGVRFRSVVSERAHVSSFRQTLRGVKGYILPFLMRRTYGWADAIVAVSNGVATDLARTLSLPESAIDVVYNPVPLEDIQARSLEPLAEAVVPEGAALILAAGRLVPQKGFATLIQAFARTELPPSGQLVILGAGPLEGELKALARDLGCEMRVHFPGFVTNPFNWMRRADLFVLSSTFEGLPGTLLQAMACGTPVVSTDCPSGPREILEDGKWGRLVPVGDVGALAEAMGQTLGKEHHPDVTSRAAQFSVDAAVEGYARVLGISL